MMCFDFDNFSLIDCLQNLKQEVFSLDLLDKPQIKFSNYCIVSYLVETWNFKNQFWIKEICRYVLTNVRKKHRIYWFWALVSLHVLVICVLCRIYIECNTYKSLPSYLLCWGDKTRLFPKHSWMHAIQCTCTIRCIDLVTCGGKKRDRIPLLILFFFFWKSNLSLSFCTPPL